MRSAARPHAHAIGGWLAQNARRRGQAAFFSRRARRFVVGRLPGCAVLGIELRCQLVHGAATCNGQLNRTALRRCSTMLGHLLNAILLVWIDHGADEDWGPMCYPPQHKRNGRTAIAASHRHSCAGRNPASAQ